MKKQTIAVDIDDVLAAEAEFIIDYSNEHWGHSLSLDEYQEHWGELWGVDPGETERRADILHQPGIVSSYRLIERGHEALQKLAERYKLVIVTSRRSKTKYETLQWLEENFAGIFVNIHFTGFYDDITPDSYRRTKGELLRQLGANFVIDDQLKHCRSALDNGVQAILFGNYKHQRSERLPDGVVRCMNWTAVQEYFDGIGS